MKNKVKVGIVHLESAVYPKIAPYNPSEKYPEYPFAEIEIGQKNYAYASLRELFLNLGLDKENYGAPRWNPFGYLIKPGMTVVIKPNFVLSRHPEKKDLYSIITHPAVLRAIADYCWIALKGEGRIIITDAPQYNCNFSELIEATKLDEVCRFYSSCKGPSVELINLQPYWSKSLHMPSCIRQLPGDPKGNVTVNLGRDSAFYNCPNPQNYYGAVYHRQETMMHHTGEKQEYKVSRTIMDADVFISVPKLKVHKKVGVTLNGKGLVGICTNKNYLVHYRLGTPSEGGDQFPENVLTTTEKKIIKFERLMYDKFLARKSIPAEMVHRFIYGFLYLKVLKPLGLKVSLEKRLLDAGNWYGNDSAWRMVVDLLKIIYFADSSGNMSRTIQRKMFSIIDGVIGGENKGPLSPDPKSSGVLIGGENLIAVDLVATRLMGFDPQKLKQFSVLESDSFDFGVKSLNDIEVVCNNLDTIQCLNKSDNRCLNFKPYPGWVGHIEV
ncbi:MAG: DUF362 domain-containing protein [Candidatus Omnitrophica bacterium]|nr:DUF362 domain-containing protein [Candidatus Omnitrophota bacterium]